MKSRFAVFPSVCVLILALVSPLLNASPVSSLSKAVMKFFAKEVAEEGVDKVSKEVGEKVIQRVSAKILREGGESAVTEATELAAKHGPDVIRALDNTAAPAKLVRVLNELPAEEVPSAAARLASGSRGKQLAQATETLGVDVIRAETRHPGVGLELVKVWPDGGGVLCRRLNHEQALALGKHLDDLVEIPAGTRKRLFEVVQSDKDRFFAWLGKFIVNNPGKTIGSATFLAVFLPNAERILGGDEIVFDENGSPVVVRKPGLVEMPANKIAESVASGVFWLLGGVGIVVILWLARLLLFGTWWNARDRREALARERPTA